MSTIQNVDYTKTDNRMISKFLKLSQKKHENSVSIAQASKINPC